MNPHPYEDDEFNEQTCDCVSLLVHLATTNCESNTFPAIIIIMMMTVIMMTMMMISMMVMKMVMLIVIMMTHSWIWIWMNTGNVNVMNDKRTFDDRNFAEYNFGSK